VQFGWDLVSYGIVGEEVVAAFGDYLYSKNQDMRQIKYKEDTSHSEP
jgi:hypothetical protein